MLNLHQVIFSIIVPIGFIATFITIVFIGLKAMAKKADKPKAQKVNPRFERAEDTVAYFAQLAQQRN